MALTCVGHYQDVNDENCIEGLTASLNAVRKMADHASGEIQIGHLNMGEWASDILIDFQCQHVLVPIGLWLGEHLESESKSLQISIVRTPG